MNVNGVIPAYNEEETFADVVKVVIPLDKFRK